MRIPHKVQKAILKRAKAAYDFCALDLSISQWLEKNHINCDYIYLHEDTLLEPDKVALETLTAIVSKNNNDDDDKE